MNTRQKIEQFLRSPAFAVVGASNDPVKFGYKVYMNYLRHNMKAFPINPNAQEIGGNKVYPDIASLPEKVDSVSIITPPPVTEKVVEQAIKAGVKNIWMQPGAESVSAVEKAEQAGVNVIHGGPCFLVEVY